MDHTIVFDQVSYHYNANTPFEVAALFDVNLTIPPSDCRHRPYGFRQVDSDSTP